MAEEKTDGAPEAQAQRFDPTKHLIKVQGGREYLPVAWRVFWLRQEHPGWGIHTKMVQFDVEQGYAVFHATITDEEGRVIAEGTAKETQRGFPDYLEKAETAAIGRACGNAGYGTQFSPDMMDADKLADAPQERRGGGQAPAQGDGRSAPQGSGQQAPEKPVCREPGCGVILTQGQAAASKHKFGEWFCPDHQKGREPLPQAQGK